MELTELLEENRVDPLLNQLLQDYAGDLAFSESHPLPLLEMRSTYRLRARRNEDAGEPIQGFRELMAGLDRFSGDAVVIYSFPPGGADYKVFADVTGTKLIGVLKFPAESLNVIPAAQTTELQTA